MNIITLSIGSNTRRSRMRVACAIAWLKRHFSLVAVSDIYSTPEISGRFCDYSNAVAIIKSNLSAEVIEQHFKEYERCCGRTPASKIKGKIPIDLDLVIFNDFVIRSKELNHNHFSIGWHQISNNYR
ncbi:MAG: 2-amino-4-hydroxy-6-hydroxymethyldihydropteridine diphosphokinase [Muribaculum sp.]|nr:2-amino-4-hydroxy-6-hydroxymethyldihydropteridine diphosphokinase [Muribaculaceae bacterium]MCM1080364.1 2-amino-4-hydroxy-6-hydroxymethyldihydropteridine diphosphokinase [Muribaculum sp.]